ncbi:MAG: DUF4287 domain-containing protein [Candidatus Planktophila sp.]
MPKSGDREAYFPLIEKKYGEKMAYWFKVMKQLEGEKYPVQVAHLKENYGFSQAHANALVMYSRGSESSKRFETPAQYYKTIDATQAKTIKAIFKAIQSKYPELELVIAWNQPMLKLEKSYLFGCSTATHHILIAPWNQNVLKKYTPKFKDFKVNKKTIALPNDWKVDAKLLQAMMKDSIAAL